MASDLLKALIALKRARPYDPDQSIAQLRGPEGSGGGHIPRAGTRLSSVDADGVGGEWVTHGAPKHEGVFMFLHGGGYYRSSARESRRIASDLSQACGGRVFTVDYRLAPEHPFPAAIDDTYQAYGWLRQQGIPAAHIIVGGSSAGGGLAAALLNKLKARSEPLPSAAVLLSPWTDLTQSAATFITNAATDPMISQAYLDRMAAQYLGDAAPDHPLASPVRADLAGLPPMLIQVGNAETMLGDAAAYHRRARAAGVKIEWQEYDDVIHGWHNSAHLIADIPETLAALTDIGQFCARHSPPRRDAGQPDARDSH